MMHLTQKLYDFRHYYVGYRLIMQERVNEVASVCFYYSRHLKQISDTIWFLLKVLSSCLVQ